ncbi:TlpA family protein disulfide reductase [Nonomuraea sp. NPDC059007]|uniref:TlpA family protein disulfide reductase n=1 Tax=Nonomuraea sp. NPDC059007 TaxID=3346692 RepID=UPI0036AD8E4E
MNMIFLTALGVVTLALCLLNVLLTYSVIRSLNRTGPDPSERLSIMPGEAVGDFEVATTTGRPLSTAALGETTLIGFFAPGCSPCEEAFPPFVEFAQGWTGNVLAVIVTADRVEAGTMISAAEEAADVVVEPIDGQLCRAFGLRGTPAIRIVRDRKILHENLPVRAT